MEYRIKSIHFAPLRADRPAYGGYYNIPAWDKEGEPEVLTVTDMVQREEGPFTTSGVQGKRQKLRYDVRADQIARDIVNYWTTAPLGTTATCHPGVWIVREWVNIVNDKGIVELDADGHPKTRAATPREKDEFEAEDLAHAIDADAEYAQLLVMGKDEVDGLDSKDPRKVGHNWTTARLAAAHYGYERSPLWMGKARQIESKMCPYCGFGNPPQLILCTKCQQVINPEKWAIMKAEEEVQYRKAKALADAKMPTQKVS